MSSGRIGDFKLFGAMEGSGRTALQDKVVN
jgi:hypothetical protein